MKKMFVVVVVCVGIVLFGAETNSVAKVYAPKDKQIQCCAVTKSGSRCTRRARPGERYCKQHAADVFVRKTPKQCCSITEKGVRCTCRPEPNRRYCKRHLAR